MHPSRHVGTQSRHVGTLARMYEHAPNARAMCTCMCIRCAIVHVAHDIPPSRQITDVLSHLVCQPQQSAETEHPGPGRREPATTRRMGTTQTTQPPPPILIGISPSCTHAPCTRQYDFVHSPVPARPSPVTQKPPPTMANLPPTRGTNMRDGPGRSSCRIPPQFTSGITSYEPGPRALSPPTIDQGAGTFEWNTAA